MTTHAFAEPIGQIAATLPAEHQDAVARERLLLSEVALALPRHISKYAERTFNCAGQSVLFAIVTPVRFEPLQYPLDLVVRKNGRPTQ